MIGDSKADLIIRGVLENGDAFACEATYAAPSSSVHLAMGERRHTDYVPITMRVRDWLRAAYELGKRDAVDRG